MRWKLPFILVLLPACLQPVSSDAPCLPREIGIGHTYNPNGYPGWIIYSPDCRAINGTHPSGWHGNQYDYGIVWEYVHPKKGYYGPTGVTIEKAVFNKCYSQDPEDQKGRGCRDKKTGEMVDIPYCCKPKKMPEVGNNPFIEDFYWPKKFDGWFAVPDIAQD